MPNTIDANAEYIPASLAGLRLGETSHEVYRLLQKGILRGTFSGTRWRVEAASVEQLRLERAARAQRDVIVNPANAH